jgi:hypothetical protein
MRLPISASSFGRICGAFAIRNDLLTFPIETFGMSMAQLSRLSSATNRMQQAGKARCTSLDVGQRCQPTEGSEIFPISAAQPFCILGKTTGPPGAGAPIGEWSRDYSEDRGPYRRWPRPRPRIPARRRRAPTVRFITFDTLVTGVRAFE